MLSACARSVLETSPCSLEMPAGSGKTQLLAAAVAAAAEDGKRSLILTHTNAGVDALVKRLKKFGVPRATFHIDTITSWAFMLVRAYGDIAQQVVPEVPDWSQSRLYIQAATRVAAADAIRAMHADSFDYFFVDEYQDCNVLQHDLIIAIAASVPNAIVLGDRLQGIFGFRDKLVDWDTDVVSSFPAMTVECLPHRWAGHNPELGQWLLDLRPQIQDGSTIDFASINIPGVSWVSTSARAVATAAYSFGRNAETVVLLDKWAPDVAGHAGRLGGVYSVMEDIQGNFMLAELNTLPPLDSPLVAYWLAQFAKKCAIGLAGLDRPVLDHLQANQPVSHYTRPGLKNVLARLDALRCSPSGQLLLDVAASIVSPKTAKLYRWEAWNDTLAAIENSIESGCPPLEEFGRVRDRLRKAGRRGHTRIASRTLLVKGLEYDHVIVADMQKMRDPRNLYVALTRARKSVTLVGPTPRVVLKDD